MQASGSPAPSANYAGWWVRFFAYFVDNLIIGIPASIVGGIIAAVTGAFSSTNPNGGGVFIFYAILVLATVGYYVYFWTQRDGQTIMNKALGIKVAKTDGSPITTGTAIIRYIGYIINSIIFGLPIGFIWAAFDSQKQGWHDKIAGTIVVKTS
jgi:uncharacterized RDD family membrane protein YckC